MVLELRDLIPSWIHQAPCRGSDDFLPPRGARLSAVRVRRAKRVCLTACPFRTECLEMALDGIRHPHADDPSAPGDVEPYIPPEGIWGGTTPAERRAVAALPRPQQLAVLGAWLLIQTEGAFPLAAKEEIRERTPA